MDEGQARLYQGLTLYLTIVGGGLTLYLTAVRAGVSHTVSDEEGTVVFGYTGSVSDYVGLGGTFHVGGDTIEGVPSPPTSLGRGSNTSCTGCMQWGWGSRGG